MIHFRTTYLLLCYWFCTVTASLAQNATVRSLQQQIHTIEQQWDKREEVLEFQLHQTDNGQVVINGQTTLPEAKKQIMQRMHEQGIDLIDSLRLLPEAALGEHTRALVTLSVANLRASPNHASELVSQALMGTPLRLLDVHDNWYRVQTPDRYIGWTNAAALHLITPQAGEQWTQTPRCIFNQPVGHIVEQPRKNSPTVADVVLGNLMQTAPARRGYLKVTLPDGRCGYLKKKQCRPFEQWSRNVPHGSDIIATAKQMNGFPYLWGGTSAKGIDCSGFVAMTYLAHGIVLRRDASQQVQCGQRLAIDNPLLFEAGDLLFFGTCEQHVTHVGISLGGGRFIHASGRVHISSLIAGDPDHVPDRHLVAACRVLNAIGMPGITPISLHPWYTHRPNTVKP